MNWWICFILAVASLAGSAVMAVQAARKPRKSGAARPMNILFAGVLVTTFISMLPLYREIIGETAEHGLKTVLFSLHNTFQFFTIDADKDIILNSIHSPSPVLNNAYAVLLSLDSCVTICGLPFLKVNKAPSSPPPSRTHNSYLPSPSMSSN